MKLIERQVIVHSRILMFLLFAASLFILPSFANAQISAGFTKDRLNFDGVPNENFWKNIEPLTDFTQRELIEGAEPTEKTEVRFAFDDDNLIIGIICYDSEPSKIIHKQLKTDTDPGSDDRISIIFDTYRDFRSGYLFSVNPNGMRYDATFQGGATDENTNWDGIWDARAKIVDYGWTCEIVIPFKTLRYPVAESQLWGMNIKRSIRRKNEEVLFRGWKQNDQFFQLAKSGTLSIDKKLSKTLQLDLKPYVLGGLEEERKTKSVNGNTDEYIDKSNIFHGGMDLKYGVNSNTTIDVTVKTDFAQIESDKEVINLSRFSLFYPEKRDFFLEGSDIFDFTQGGTRLFYSRRIGISNSREEIPILGGVKLTQKTGKYRIGLMTMQTESIIDKFDEKIPSANYSVLRVKRDIFGQSYLGFIATSHTDADDHDNQVYGADFIHRTNTFLGDKNFEVHGYLSGSLTDGKGHDNLAGRLYIAYPNDLINSYILHHVIDTNFNPEVGYVSRTGIRNSIWRLLVEPRPDLPYIKKFLFKPIDINYTTDMSNVLLTRNFQFKPFGILTNTGDEIGYYMQNDYDYVHEKKGYFNMFNGKINIENNIYDWWSHVFYFKLSPTRPVYASFQVQQGDYYDGEKTTYNSAATFKTNPHYALSADLTVNKISMGGREYSAREYGGRLEVDFSTNLSSSTFVQYNNETNEVNVNFRIHYIPKIGSDLYLVYNRLMDESRDYDMLSSTGMLKLDYTYRF